MANYLKIYVTAVSVCIALILIGRPTTADAQQALPRSVQRVLYQAQTLITEKRPEEARRKLEAYRQKKERTHYLIEFTIGDTWMLAEAYSRAAGAYRKALDLKSDFAPAWMNLGKAAYEMTDYPTAATCFHRAYQTDAELHPARLYYSATAYLLAESPRKGLEMFQTLIAKHPDTVKLAWKPALVQLYMALDQPQAALPVIEELAVKSTGTQKTQWQETLLGHYLVLDMTDRAIAYARDLTREAPTVSRWWKALAHLLLEQQAHEPALEALMIYAGLTPPSRSEKRLLADLNLQAGIPIMAVRYYRELAACETDTVITTRLAHALRRLDRRDEALQAIESCLEKKNNKDLLWLKAELLYEMKQYNKAAAAYRLCAQDAPRAGRALLMAGYALLQAGDIPAARAELIRATAYPKQAKSARAALGELENSTSGDGS